MSGAQREGEERERGENLDECLPLRYQNDHGGVAETRGRGGGLVLEKGTQCGEEEGT